MWLFAGQLYIATVLVPRKLRAASLDGGGSPAAGGGPLKADVNAFTTFPAGGAGAGGRGVGSRAAGARLCDALLFGSAPS